jgi:hypothetical protein
MEKFKYKTMRKLTGVLLIAIVAVSCTPSVDYKVVRDDVMKFHDVVMADHGKVVNNQMVLDTLLKNMKDLKAKSPALDTIKEKEVIKAMITRLTHAEDGMNDWMHKFEPDVTGKSNEQAVSYFKAEKIKIAVIDSLYKVEIKASDEYLSNLRK